MTAVLLLLLGVGVFAAAALLRFSLTSWAVAYGAYLWVAIVVATGQLFPLYPPWQPFLWLPVAALLLLSREEIRRQYFVRPLYGVIKRRFPSISKTEQEALDAGTVGWDAEIFRGKPDWEKLHDIPGISLTRDEQDFLNGPTEELCSMLNDWEIRFHYRDIPDEVWDFLKRQGFLGMLISKQHGGLGFSAQAQSLILGKIASRSSDVVIVAMVPNSLGPGELVEKYGTDAQKAQYLPALARGKEIPCFALTSPDAGSDAASMRDVGVVCRRMFQGEERLGVALTWNKRYITLAPKATLLGLAFRLFDPEGLLGDEEGEGEDDRGVTLALVPTSHPGVHIGRRHLPGGGAFPNGPTNGRDVFIPIDWIVGGADGVGRGWGMLMECLSVGRAISLPATSAAAIKAALRVTTNYARLRRQFGIPIGKMEGIQEPLAEMVENAYVIEAARAMTAAMVSKGAKPAVISALLKYNATERMRQSLLHAMDIHGGRAICDGPSNYLQGAYQALPVSITVEGANILTRSLITFGQGVLRCHPFLRREVECFQDENTTRAVKNLDELLAAHMSWALSNGVSALLHNLSGAKFANGVVVNKDLQPIYRELDGACRNFAFMADVSIGLLAGGIKTRQKISGRLADALSELYILSAALKRYQDDGENRADLPVLRHAARNGLYRFESALRGVIDNFPVAPARWIMRLTVFPLGQRRRPASDRSGREIVRLAMSPGAVRDRLTRDVYLTNDPVDVTGLLEHCFELAADLEGAEARLEKAIKKGEIRRLHGKDWFADAARLGIVSAEEAAALRELDKYIARVIGVDHFAPEEVTPCHGQVPASKHVAAE